MTNVLEWKKRKPAAAQALYKALADAHQNMYIHMSELQSISVNHPAQYQDSLRALSREFHQDWQHSNDGSTIHLQVMRGLSSIWKAMDTTRSLLRDLGRLADVPIEPSCQTDLLDATIALPGVIGGGVPGAGGFDAIFIVYIEGIDTSKELGTLPAIDDLWINWDKMSVCPLAVRSAADVVNGAGFRFERNPKEATQCLDHTAT